MVKLDVCFLCLDDTSLFQKHIDVRSTAADPVKKWIDCLQYLGHSAAKSISPQSNVVMRRLIEQNTIF